MDRTIRLMRRTLQCAALACPLSLLSPWLAAGVQILWTLHAALYMPITAPLWSHRHTSPAATLQRTVLPCSAALFLSTLPQLVLLFLFPNMHVLTKLLMHALTALTSILLQSILIYRLPHYRREHSFLSLNFFLLFIVCMQSSV